MAEDKAFNIFVDSSFDEKKKVCGIGIAMQKGGVWRKPISLYISADSNNYGELFGCYIGAILSGGAKCTIYTDSQTALGYIHKEIKDKPFTSQEKYYRHQEMKVLAYKTRKVNPSITFVHTKGHRKYFQNNSIGNNMADILAKLGRAKFYEK